MVSDNQSDGSNVVTFRLPDGASAATTAEALDLARIFVQIESALDRERVIAFAKKIVGLQ